MDELKTVLVILYLVFVLGIREVCLCNLKCNCSLKTELKCSNVTVQDITIPESVHTVVLTDFDVSKLEEGIFQKNSNWTRIQSLYIYGKYGETLGSNVFFGLLNLQKMFFHHGNMFRISPHAFEGLDSLKTLDLSNTRKVPVGRVMVSISTPLLPKLETVVLQNLAAYYPSAVNMSDSFFKSLTRNGSRNIKYIDMSNVNILELNYLSVMRSGLCNSLKTVILRNCTIVSATNYVTFTPCPSLRVVDISGSHFLMTRFNITPSSTDFFCLAVIFYRNIEEYYGDNLLRENLAPDMVLMNEQLDMSGCDMRVRKVSLRGNTLRWLNVSATLHSTTARSFEWGDAAYNRIEYISPKLLAPSVNIKHLDFSYNNLHVMQQRYPRQFEVLFHAQEKIECLNISGNGLDDIPVGMFLRNRNLIRLDLSNNKLEDITFEIRHLEELRSLNLAVNGMATINPEARKQLEHMADVARQRLRDFKVDLNGNNFSCSCTEEDIGLIRWLRKHSQTFLVRRGGGFICVVNEHHVDILGDGLQKLTEYCRWQRQKLYMYIFIPLFTVLIVLSSILIGCRFKVYRNKRRLEKRFNAVIEQLRKNQFPKRTLTFVSFCSEDEPTVLQKIIPSLQTTLKSLVDTDKELVAWGDTSFRPGFPLCGEIIKGIDDAAVTILIVSKTFCKKHWCRQEMREAYDQNKPIILIMMEKVEERLMEDTLKRIFERYSHARWVADDTGGGHIEPDWVQFCRSVISLAGPVVRMLENTRPVKGVDADEKRISLEFTNQNAA